MNTIEKLLKSKVINFPEVLLQNYKRLSLDEVDSIILIKLYYLSENNIKFLDLDKLCMEMTISMDSLSIHVLELVKKGFIELIVTFDGAEEFVLDGTYKQIGELLDKPEIDNSTSEDLICEIVEYVESTYNRVVTATDLVIINKWVEDKFLITDIKEAILQSLRAKKMHLKYADAILVSKNNAKTKTKESLDESDLELRELLQAAYGRK